MREIQVEPVRYIGVTGFMTRRGVEVALSFAPKHTELKLMVGVLASSKTLSGQTNRYPNRYPKVEDIIDIFTADERVLNLIHYSTDTLETLVEELEELVVLGGPNLHGFQLNIAWPDTKTLQRFRLKHPSLHLVLQIGGKAMRMVDDFEELRQRVGDYYDPQGFKTIDTVLIDPSGGKGIPFSPYQARKYLFNLQGFSGLGLGVAGGLGGPDTDHLLSGLKDFTKSVSVDAEGNLRTKDSWDALDMDRVREYLQKAYSILG